MKALTIGSIVDSWRGQHCSRRQAAASHLQRCPGCHCIQQPPLTRVATHSSVPVPKIAPGHPRFQTPSPPSAFADLTIALRHNAIPTYHSPVRIIVGPCVLWLIYTPVYKIRLKRKRATKPFNPPNPCFSRPAMFPRTTAVANSGKVCPDEPTPHRTERLQYLHTVGMTRFEALISCKGLRREALLELCFQVG
jgi:hypothetical protein